MVVLNNKWWWVLWLQFHVFNNQNAFHHLVHIHMCKYRSLLLWNCKHGTSDVNYCDSTQQEYVLKMYLLHRTAHYSIFTCYWKLKWIHCFGSLILYLFFFHLRCSLSSCSKHCSIVVYQWLLNKVLWNFCQRFFCTYSEVKWGKRWIPAAFMWPRHPDNTVEQLSKKTNLRK